MTKQIATSDIVKKLMDEGFDYFTWLQMKVGLGDPLEKHLEGQEFKSVDGIDDVILKSAKENLREEYAEQYSDNPDEQVLIRKSVRGGCSLLEIIVYIGESVRDIVSTADEDETYKFVKLLLQNAGYYKTSDQDQWLICTTNILDRQYEDGKYGLFNCNDEKKPLWQQMNDWIDQHTNEDGEWVD